MRETIIFMAFCLTFAALMAPVKQMAGPRGVLAFVIAGLLASLLARSWVEVPPGQYGTIWDPFAKGIQQRDLGEGWHLIRPWASLKTWSARTQEYTMMDGADAEGEGEEAIVCQTREGLQVKIDTTVLYSIDQGNAHRLWRAVGPNYTRVIVLPTTREAVRSLVSQYPIMSVYSNAEPSTINNKGVTSFPGKRKEVEDRILAAMRPAFEARGLTLERVLLRNVSYLSDAYEAAIVNKQVAQQQVLTQNYLLEIERIRAQQKVVQSEGQAEAIRLRGQALRANRAVVGYEFVRRLPADLDIQVLPGAGNVLLNLPQQERPAPVDQDR